jgi:hypothetical protein
MAAARARTGRDRGPAKPAVRSDVWTGLLALALLAQIAGAVFLYLDYSSYPEGKSPPDVSASAPNQNKPGTGGDAADKDKGGADKDKDKANK